jgi:hypothetical protein
VRGLNVGFSSPSAEDPEAGDRHRKLGPAGEPSSGILRYVFVDSITVLIFHRQALRPLRLLYSKISQELSAIYRDSNLCERIF